MKIKHLIVGAGLSGAVLAERIASLLKEPVTVIEKKDHIAGNCYDYRDKNGICIHKYGPHIFHTKNQTVWNYLSKFTKWHPFFLNVEAFVDGQTIPLPFNLNSIRAVFPKHLADIYEQKLIEKVGFGNQISILDLKQIKDPDLENLSSFVYEKVCLHYYKKQWGMTPEELDPSVAKRVPICVSKDNRYFHDTYQAIPMEGYTHLIENLLNNPLIDLRLNTPFNKSEFDYENLYYTGPIDEFFDFDLGELPYRSLSFDIRELNYPFFQKSVVVSYPTNYDFTRICEHKYFLNDQSNKTVVSFEYPAPFKRGVNERYYPIPQEKNQLLYQKYIQKAKNIQNIHFLGRLGDYKYYNMDTAVERVLTFFEDLYGKN